MIKLRERTKRRAKRLLGVLLLVAVLGGAQIWLWDWVRAVAIDLRENLERPSMVAGVERLTGELRREQAEISGRASAVQNVLASSDDTLRLLETLETLAQQRSIGLEVVSIDGDETAVVESELGQLEVRLLATGAPEALLNYVEKIENLQELTEIKLLVLAPASPADQEAGSHVASIEIIFYLQDHNVAAQ